MRVRLKSLLDGVSLGCWYEIPLSKKSAFIEDLLQQLHSDLTLDFPVSELALELEDFDLLRRSRIEGVLRDGDVVLLKRLTSRDNSEVSQMFLAAPLNEGNEVKPPKHDLQMPSVELSSHVQDIMRRDVEDLWSHIEPLLLHCSKDISHVSERISRLESKMDQSSKLAKQLQRVKDDEDRLVVLEEVIGKQNLEIATIVSSENRLEAWREGVQATVDKSLAQCEALMNSTRALLKIQQKDTLVAEERLFSLSGSALSKSSSSSASSSSSSSSDSESDQNSSSSSSTSSSTDHSSLMVSRSSSIEETSSKVELPSKISSFVVAKQGVPYKGSLGTSSRNDRRKRQRTLQRLIDAGKLPVNSNFRTLTLYQQLYNAGDVIGLQELQATIIPASNANTASINWDYPDEPEEGWEKRLTVKEIECEAEHREETLIVRQYEEDIERSRAQKRRRTGAANDSGNKSSWARSNMIQSAEEDVTIDASMYGDQESVIHSVPSIALTESVETKQVDIVNGKQMHEDKNMTRSEVEDEEESSEEESEEEEDDYDNSNLEDGELEDNGVPEPSIGADAPREESHPSVSLAPILAPYLPAGFLLWSDIDANDPCLTRIGTNIAFRHMEMVNFRPSISNYKRGKIIQSSQGILHLELDPRDVQPIMYDYEGERVPGLFDLIDDATGDVIEGHLRVDVGELIDILAATRSNLEY